jgi:[phosphatase 2A protein]-leucine-carboxy methyltransferase
MLDEVEELDLVLQHYAITWGIKIPNANGSNLKVNWLDWGLKPSTLTGTEDTEDYGGD